MGGGSQTYLLTLAPAARPPDWSSETLNNNETAAVANLAIVFVCIHIAASIVVAMHFGAGWGLVTWLVMLAIYCFSNVIVLSKRKSDR